jgi:RNA polymerase sigma factor (sigma-70 family)
VRGEVGALPSLRALAWLLAEARRRVAPTAERELFTRILAQTEGSIQRWACGVVARTPGLVGLSAYAVREDLCQELAPRLWERLALDPSEPWQLFFARVLEYEQRHVAAAYMRRSGYWPRKTATGHTAKSTEAQWPQTRTCVPESASITLEDSELSAAMDELGAAELAELVSHVQRLPARERTGIVLRFWRHASDREIAEAMGVTPRTVRNVARRAYARLRACYGAHDGSSGRSSQEEAP